MIECRQPRTWGYIAAIAAALAPSSAIAQDLSQPSVLLRAVNQDVSGDVVRFVAANTQPAQLDAANFDVDITQTPNEIITRRCGSVRSEYYEEFLRLNGTHIAPDMPIGEEARTLYWPSCLYVRSSPAGVTTIVGKNDSADKVYTRLTGGHATRRELEEFFGAPATKLKQLQPGDMLAGGHLTAAVQVIPTTDVDEFRAKFKALVEADPKTKARTVEELVGEIVLPIEEDAQGGIASGKADCIPSGPPFDAVQVQAALAFSRKRQRALEIFPGQSSVIIVDNGFRGVALGNGESDPFIGSPFAKRFFQGDSASTIARKIIIGRPYWPILTNSSYASPAQGHGTHVAGLALGGPGFAEARRDSSYTDVWARLIVLNVSDGDRALASGTVETLRGYLGVPEDNRIVNMSISYDGNVSPDIATAFDGMFKFGTNTLFVVAAGNRSHSVSGDTYPAAMGALQKENVVTVAAIGGDGRLTPFSNFGPKTVDIAAPGCQLYSWLDSSPTQTPLSGTSQATPIVTFAASLIRSLAPKATPPILKTRLVISGDLMHPDDYGKTAYRVTLNIPKALYMFDDYVAIRGEQPRALLGRATRLTGVRCAADPPSVTRGVDAVWSLKRGGGGFWLFAGRNTGAEGKVEEPCVAADPKAGKLRFVSEYRLNGAELEVVSPPEEIELPLTDIAELIMRARIPD